MKKLSRTKKTKFSALLVSTIALTIAAPYAYAQEDYTGIIVFGDSYNDPGVNDDFDQPGAIYPKAGNTPENIDAQYDYVAYPYWFQNAYSIANNNFRNFAVGGGTVRPDPNADQIKDLEFQVAALGDYTFQSSDLVVFNMGANDGLDLAFGDGYDEGFGTVSGYFSANAAAVGREVGEAASFILRDLADRGAETFFIASYTDLTAIPLVQFAPDHDAVKEYGVAFHDTLQSGLYDLAQSGTRVVIFDQSKLMQQISENLEEYGLESYTFEGDRTTSLFNTDFLHMTSRGYQIASDYVMNLNSSLSFVNAQSEIIQSTSQNFLHVIDSHQTSKKTLNAENSSSWNFYVDGNFFNGNRKKSRGISGYSFDGQSVTLGVEHNLSSSWTIGAAFHHATPNANFANTSSTLQSDSNLYGLYLNRKGENVHLNGAVTTGSHNLATSRTGVIDTLTASVGADSQSISVNGSYLWGKKNQRYGPTIGVSLSQTSVDSYDESGDQLLAMNIPSQDRDWSLANLGFEGHFTKTTGQNTFVSTLKILAEHDFSSDSHVISGTSDNAPNLPIFNHLNDLSNGTYGRIAGTASIVSDSHFQLGINGSSTFGRSSGEEYSLGLSLRFF